MAGLFAALQSLVQPPQEVDGAASLVPFGSSPAHSFSLAAAGSLPGPAVLHVYGEPTKSLQSPLSSIEVGTPIPPDKRLKFAAELFDVVDVYGERQLDAQKLQVALRVLALPHRPKDVLKRYGSAEGRLLLEEFVMFVSSAARTHQLLALIPLDLLREVRSLYGLISQRTGSLDRQELETLVAYLGLDWANEDVDEFLKSRGSHGLLQFMSTFVRIIEQGAVTGTKTLTVRNWFPGMWYVRERRREGESSGLYLVFQTASGGWSDVGKVCSAAPNSEQPFLIGLRMSDGRKYSVLISKLDAAHSRPFKQAAELYASSDQPLGVVSTVMAAKLINSITGFVNVGALSRADIIRTVFSLLVGDVEVVQEDELLVALKVLGQHAEPEHMAYLLSLAPRKALGSLGLAELVALLETVDIKLALPLTTIEKLKEAFHEFDEDGDGALSAEEVRSLTTTIGMGWTAKDVMTVIDVGKKQLKSNALVPIDFLQFIDAVVEIHGDPFYELRYRYLFRLIDLDNSDAVQDEEIVPLLRAAGLDEAATRAAAMRLLGNQLTMNYQQFAAAMLEEEITGEPFPKVLLQMARAFSNIDVDDRFEIDATKLLLIFRKLGVKFTLAERDALFKQMDSARRGAASFSEFAVSFSRVDRSKLGDLAEAFNFETLAGVTSYELTSSVEELDALRDVSGRPVLERTAAALLERKGRTVAAELDKKAVESQRRVEGLLDQRKHDGPSSFTTTQVLRVTLCCWFCVLRCTTYGVASGGFNVLLEQASNVYFPISENEPTSAYAGYNVWVHYIIQYLPSIIVSFIEAMIIYYDLLRTALAVAEIGGLKLWPLDPVRQFVSNSIMAEALELGHPSYVRYGIDPMRGSSRLVLYLCGLLYSARGGLSKFILKIILRRVVSRSAVKGVFPLIGLPIVAFWNAVLARQVMHAVRTVALGRMCITTVTDTLLGMHQELSRQVAAGVELQKAVELSRAKSFAVASPENSFDALAMPDSLKAAILRSVSVAVVSSREFHPNLELLMKHLIFRLRINPETIPELDNIDLYYKSCLPSLSRVDSYTVLTFLAFALLLDGDLTVTNKIFIKRAQTCCGLTPNLAGLNRIADKFENLSLHAEDAVFAVYDVRERDGGVPDITAMERAEEAIGIVLKLLAF